MSKTQAKAFYATQDFFNRSREIQQLVGVIEEAKGEITPEIEAAYSRVTEGLNETVDICVEVRKRLETMENHFREQAKPFINLARAYQRMHEFMTGKIKSELIASGRKSIVGEVLGFELRRSSPKLEIDDADKIPKKYKTLEVDNTLVTNALKAGKEVPGAHLEESVALYSTILKKEIV